jgi:hypothetical protein
MITNVKKALVEVNPNLGQKEKINLYDEAPRTTISLHEFH